MIRTCRFASTKSLNALKAAQFSVKDIIENSLLFEESITRRANHSALKSLNYIIETRPKFLALTKAHDVAKSNRNKLAQSMMSADNKDEARAALARMKTEIKQLTLEHAEMTDKLHRACDRLPNLLDPTVPQDPLEGEVVEIINGESPELIERLRPASDVFDHKTIAERMNMVDFSTASRVSGSSWYYLLNDGAWLEQALIQYALSKARKYGYKMVSPPTLVKHEVIDACGFKPKDKNDENHIYGLEDQDLGLTGTAEIALAALHSSETLDEKSLPTKYVGLSRAFRAEAGARGKDTKGLYRVHEFNKVELFHFTTPEKAAEELEQLKQLQVEIISELGLKAKMINMPTTDLGAPAMKKYDCEAWMPGRGSWGELTSSSNCGDYQARRLGIRFKQHDGKPAYAHTLNGTCVAVPRVIVAIIEQNYDPRTDSIVIPKVLRPYMDGRERITKQE